MSKDKEKLYVQLSAYVDGELSPGQAQRMAKALETDADLRAEFHAIVATRNLLRRLPREQAPPSLLPEVMTRVEHRRLLQSPAPTTRGGAPRWAQAIAAAAVVLLAVGLGWQLYTTMKTPPAPGDSLVMDTPPPLAPDDDLRGLRADRYRRGEKDGKENDVVGKGANEIDGLGRYAKGGSGSGGGGAAPVRNIILCTDDLSDTNKDVYSTLAANGIQAVRGNVGGNVDSSVSATRLADLSPEPGSNYAYSQRVTAVSNQIVVLAYAEQVDDLIAQLKPLSRGRARSRSGRPAGRPARLPINRPSKADPDIAVVGADVVNDDRTGGAAPEKNRTGEIAPGEEKGRESEGRRRPALEESSGPLAPTPAPVSPVAPPAAATLDDDATTVPESRRTGTAARPGPASRPADEKYGMGNRGDLRVVANGRSTTPGATTQHGAGAAKPSDEVSSEGLHRDKLAGDIDLGERLAVAGGEGEQLRKVARKTADEAKQLAKISHQADEAAAGPAPRPLPVAEGAQQGEKWKLAFTPTWQWGHYYRGSQKALTQPDQPANWWDRIVKDTWQAEQQPTTRDVLARGEAVQSRQLAKGLGAQSRQLTQLVITVQLHSAAAKALPDAEDAEKAESSGK